jgi:hypothetical protein
MEHLHYPNESTEYRAARNALLDDEIALRAQIEVVAAKRRCAPLFNPWSPEFIANPYPSYHLLRETEPMHYMPLGLYVASTRRHRHDPAR